ncbi:RND family transporter [Pleionea sp. CnH1-48]|uniref:efflux RND transporter permease subunit n=1 Tax=Pleionea sp. CnH1-48 TaxID=2954494 RepID=UPI00209837B1|nr:MMPL family transporter [Pleionea sp. CnH1-48]MCO7222795.1 MMPL family transporter [Pleionea sp. CnH1-48]
MNLPTLFKLNLRYGGILSLAILILALLGLPNLTRFYISNDFKVYFGNDNPQLKTLRQFEQTFNSQDNLVIVVHSSESLLSQQGLTAIYELTEQIRQLPHIQDSLSLTHYEYTQASEDELKIAPLIGELPVTAQNVRFTQHALQDDHQLYATWLSPSETTAFVHATVNIKERETPKQLYQAALNWLKPFQQKYPDLSFQLAGSIMSNITLEQAVTQDLITLIPISYLIIVIGLMVLLRSIRAAIVTLVVITLSMLMTFEVYSLFKWELTPVAGFVPSVILTLAVADCVHIYTSYQHALRELHKSPEQASLYSFKINALPITLTSFTTAVGVLFLNLSDSPPYQDLGNMIAIGVLIAWLLSLIMVPFALTHWPPHYPQQTKASNDNVIRLARFVTGHTKIFLVSGIILITLCLFSVSQLKITESWSDYFSKSFALRQTIDLINSEFDRLHRLEVILTTNKTDDSINQLKHLQTLDALEEFLANQPEVTKTQSYVGLLKQMNKNMHANQQTFYQLPTTQALAAQYLLLYELSSNQSLMLSQDHRVSHITINLKKTDSQKIIEFEQRVKHWFSQQENQGLALDLTGFDLIFAYLAEHNIHSMLSGSITALFVISVLMIFIFRSIKLGLIAFIPNLAPAIMAYGIWSATIGNIDLALTVVICMGMGIVVDDTIHFISKYHRASKSGRSTQESIEYAFSIVGKALLTTTVILTAGFSILIFSPLTPTHHTGSLLSLLLVCALIIDFIILPALLMIFANQKK